MDECSELRTLSEKDIKLGKIQKHLSKGGKIVTNWQTMLKTCFVLVSTDTLLNFSLVPAESHSHPLAIFGPIWLKIFSACNKKTFLTIISLNCII